MGARTSHRICTAAVHACAHCFLLLVLALLKFEWVFWTRRSFAAVERMAFIASIIAYRCYIIVTEFHARFGRIGFEDLV